MVRRSGAGSLNHLFIAHPDSVVVLRRKRKIHISIHKFKNSTFSYKKIQQQYDIKITEFKNFLHKQGILGGKDLVHSDYMGLGGKDR